MATLFTKIINREIPAKIIYEDEHVIAFHDNSPQAPIHILIVPRNEISGVATVPEQGDHQYLFNAARKIGEEMNLSQGYRLIINQGEHGGQTVPHLHMHLLAGRALSWPPG